jgi:hypothetical protein
MRAIPQTDPAARGVSPGFLCADPSGRRPDEEQPPPGLRRAAWYERIPTDLTRDDDAFRRGTTQAAMQSGPGRRLGEKSSAARAGLIRLLAVKTVRPPELVARDWGSRVLDGLDRITHDGHALD